MYYRGHSGHWEFLLPVCVVAFLYWFICRDFFSNDLIPGDLGDARFNIYVLEHLYRWLVGQDTSLASPEIFYPFPGSLYFSDTHFGSAIFYVIFRAIGVNEFRAFTLWFFIGYLLTFAASYLVALRLGYNSLLSTVIATVFSFSLPCLAQFGHAQLVYRFPVPLAFLSCWNFVNSGSIKHLLWLVVWISLEMLCGVYLGVFLTLALAVFMISSLLMRRSAGSFVALAGKGISDARQIFSQQKLQTGLFLATAVLIAVSAITVLAEYRSWADLYGLKRGWEEIATLLPRLSSYFVMDNLSYWKAIDQSLIHTQVPARGEQNIFVGLGVMSLFSIGLFSIFAGSTRDENCLVRSALTTIIVLVLLTMMFDRFSAYFFLTYLPGFDSIRAVARISVVLMFPTALVAAEGAQSLLITTPRTPGLVALVIFLTISLLEIRMIEKPGFSLEEAERRTSALAEEGRRVAAGKSNPVLSVREDWQLPYLTHLDAMFAAQRLGWPTTNGYSGNSPPGFEYEATDASPAHLFDAYEKWHAGHKIGPDLSATDLLGRVVRVGSAECSVSDPALTSFGPPPTFDIARQIQILPGPLERQDSRLAVGVSIHYDGSGCVHVFSLAPLRLSWRFVPVGYADDKDVDKIGWDTRVQLPEDIRPKQDVRMKVTADIPSRPGTYNIEFSMVAETSFWFHDKGMKILRFENEIKVP